MKVTTKVLGALCVVAMLGLMACGSDDDTTTNTAVTTQETAVSNVTSLKVGSTVTYNGDEYWVTKNTYATADRSAARAIEGTTETDAEIAVHVAYIQKYLDKDFRATLLKDEVGITDYVEFFLKVNREKATSGGQGELQDIYKILNADGKEIAQVSQRWNSDMLLRKTNPNLKTVDERTEFFNNMSDEELRSYDPLVITITNYPDNIADKFTLSIRYNFYDDALTVAEGHAHYRKMNLDSPYYRNRTCDYMETAVGWRGLYKRNEYSSGQVTYALLDPIGGGEIGANIMLLDIRETEEKDTNNRFILSVYGDGKVNGSTNRSDYRNQVEERFFKETPIEISATLGETKTSRTTIISQKQNGNYTEDFTGPVRIREQVSDDGGQNWTTTNGVANSDGKKYGIEVSVAEINDNVDFMTVSTETTDVPTVGGTTITVPASMTFHAHYAETDGTYPVFDNYAEITCYPVYDTEHSRIVYKVTKETIADFIAAYKADFVKLAAEAAAN